MSINSINQSIQQYIPSQEQVIRRFSPSLLGIANNLHKIALPAIALLALSSMQGAEAGPLMYASCLAGCAASGPFAPACWAACLPILAIPGP